MRLIEGLVLRPLGQEYIVTGEGLARIDFSKVISMNASAAYLWKEVQGRDFSADELARLLTGRYEVDDETARADAAKLLDTWRNAGLIEE